ncbi:hypothetical protein AC1031_002755 [Aphanomyces cochlioides]|nr:hypothetical protein AC1031_002755 [Aphanomyces cochlioides]
MFLQLIHHVLHQLGSNLPATTTPEYLVLHEDQPANNFASLLDTLNSPASYIHPRPNVYTGVISKSFYERVMPTASVDIFVSYIALHWLSRVPAPLPGGMVFCGHPDCDEIVSANAMKEWRQGAHNDLVTFLRLRATELVDHGSLCMIFAADNGNLDTKEHFICGCLQYMVADGALSSETLERMAIPIFYRSADQVLAAIAEVPELELHEHQYLTVDFTFTASIAVNLLLSVYLPTFEAAMTEEERNDPRVRDALRECMGRSSSEIPRYRTKPFYEDTSFTYFYCNLTRRNARSEPSQS